MTNMFADLILSDAAVYAALTALLGLVVGLWRALTRLERRVAETATIIAVLQSCPGGVEDPKNPGFLVCPVRETMLRALASAHKDLATT